MEGRRISPKSGKGRDINRVEWIKRKCSFRTTGSNLSRGIGCLAITL